MWMQSAIVATTVTTTKRLQWWVLWCSAVFNIVEWNRVFKVCRSRIFNMLHVASCMRCVCINRADGRWGSGNHSIAWMPLSRGWLGTHQLASKFILTNLSSCMKAGGVFFCTRMGNFMAVHAYTWQAIVFYRCSSFFRTSSWKVTERNSTKLCHGLGSEPDLKMDVLNLDSIPSPWKLWPKNCLFREFLRLHQDLSANVFGMK